MWFAAAAVVSQLAPSMPAEASVVWRGDFETGSRSQWSSAQLVSPDRAQVVPSPTRQGQYALRVEVRQGDDPINASGNRNELVKFDGSREGTEFYYAWSTLWPSSYPMTPTWQVFMQWHHPGCCGAPPVRFVLGCSARDCGAPLPDTLFFIVDGKTVWKRAPITRGVWHDFILHIKWSANPNVGFVELWYDGELVLPKRFTRTLFSSGDTNYLKMGLYRDAATQPTAVMFHDGVVQATTLAEAKQVAFGENGQSADAGTAPATDAGEELDGGTAPSDGVTTEGDGGAPAGEEVVFPTPRPPQAGPSAGDPARPDPERVDPVDERMGCTSAPGSVAWMALVAVGALQVHRRRRTLRRR